MSEEQGTGLGQAQEGASPSGAASTNEAARPPEPQEQPLTRAEVLAMQQELDLTKRELRGIQSQVDKSSVKDKGLRERIATVEAVLAQQVKDGILDEKEASAYRQTARIDALYADEPEEQESVDAGGGPGRPARDPVQARAEQIFSESGLTPADPEIKMLEGHADPFAWYTALEQAKAAKAARIARQNAQQQAPGQPAPAQQTPPAQAGVTAMDMGVGAGAPASDLETLHKQFTEAVRKDPYGEDVKRIGDLIDKKLAGG